jgi:predicted Zn-dependent peptidase
MMKLAKQELYFERQLTIDDTLERIDEVTPADVRRLAGELFVPARSGWSAVGPAQSLEKAAKEA